jgi:hypothetical protein
MAAECCFTNAAMAQTTRRRIADPPVLQDTLPTAPRAFITPGSSQQSRDRVLDLRVTYTDSQLYNPTSGHRHARARRNPLHSGTSRMEQTSRFEN